MLAGVMCVVWDWSVYVLGLLAVINVATMVFPYLLCNKLR